MSRLKELRKYIDAQLNKMEDVEMASMAALLHETLGTGTNVVKPAST